MRTALLVLACIVGCAALGDRAPPVVALPPPTPDVRISSSVAPRAAPIAPGIGVGERAPAIGGVWVAGQGPRDVDEGMGRVTVVHFWATRCLWCRRALGSFQALMNAYPGQLAVLAVSADDPDDLRAIAEATRVRYAVVWDRDGSAASRYKPPAMPTTFLVDRKGFVRFIYADYSEDDDQLDSDVQTELLRLVEEE